MGKSRGRSLLCLLPCLGIACISLALVDGQQKPKQLIGCSKPSPTAYMEWLDKGTMKQLVETCVYSPEECGSKPGNRFYDVSKSTVRTDDSVVVMW